MDDDTLELLGGNAYNFSLGFVYLLHHDETDWVFEKYHWKREDYLIFSFAIGLFILITKEYSIEHASRVSLNYAGGELSLEFKTPPSNGLADISNQISRLGARISSDLDGFRIAISSAGVKSWAAATIPPYDPAVVRRVGPHSYVIDHRISKKKD